MGLCNDGSASRQESGRGTDAERPLITVFVLNWNRRDDLLRCLESVRGQTYRPIDMLVVDNGSDDGSADAAERAFPEATVVRLDRNYGCPGGRNRGIGHAKGDYIFFVDNDGILHEQAVERAYRAMCIDRRIGVVTGRVKDFSCPQEVDERCGVESDDASRFVSSFQGGISMHRKSMYRDVGTYPDDYMYGAEETNMSLRMLDRGYLIYRDTTVVLWHKRAATARDRRREFLHARANSLATAWQLYPFELVLLYSLRYWFQDSTLAIRRRLFRAWLCSVPRSWRRAVATALRERRPVRRRTMQLYWRLRDSTITTADDAVRTEAGYWRSVWHLYLWRRRLGADS
ncbi:MAG TPA: glycosyltransferase family 2 protein [Phycisphaerae bacterium]|nr:glycosyltransferase family 2 protein [Phycisphaerae bacterium]